MEINKEFWNNHYQTGDTGWDIGHVSTPIKEYFDQVEDKSLSILIPGAGNSHEAEYLVQRGFNNVFVLDFAPIAIENFKNRVPEFPHNQLICQNFFNFSGQFDIIVEQTFFCALEPRLREDYVKKVFDLLKPKGKLIGLLFNDALNNDKPPFGGFKADYELLFSPLFYIKKMEMSCNSIAPRAGRELFINLIKKE